MRVLGVDTSLRSSGVAVIETRGSSLVAVEFGTVTTPARRPLSECLRRLHESLEDQIRRQSPEQAALEGVFFCKNVRTAVTLGHARGVVISLLALRSIPVYEYPPRRVKQAVVGYGGAEKEQVRGMVMKLLNLREDPGEDAGDALAIALCHLHTASRHAELAGKPI